MGRQVNFFMLYEDEEAFWQFVTEQGGLFLLSATQESTARPCASLPEPGSSYDWASMCIVQQHRLTELGRWSSDGKAPFRIIEEFEPVVQFGRCKHDANVIHRGRIWAAMQSTRWVPEREEEELFYKGEDFERFYDRLARWIRKQYVREPEYGFYCGPHAWAAHLAGTTLSDL